MRWGSKLFKAISLLLEVKEELIMEHGYLDAELDRLCSVIDSNRSVVGNLIDDYSCTLSNKYELIRAIDKAVEHLLKGIREYREFEIELVRRWVKRSE